MTAVPALAPTQHPEVSTARSSTSERPGPRAAARLDFIDGLRGLAILLVIADHLWNRLGMVFDRWWNPASIGYIGVDLFLMLSGFCLYWPMVKPGAREPTLREFAVRRARRILPPYYVALLICIAGSLVLPYFGHTWPEAPESGPLSVLTSGLWHIAMIHNLSPSQIGAFNGPFWSLALECDLYVAMPILVLVARRRGMLPAVALAAAVTLVYRFWLIWYCGGLLALASLGVDRAFTLCYALPGRWMEFALGMWAASLVSSGAADRLRFPAGWASLALLTAGSLWIHRVGAIHPVTDLLVSLGFLCLLLQGARRPSGSLSVSRALRWKPLVSLGLFSYSLYLVHLPLLNFAFRSASLTRLPIPVRLLTSVFLIVPAIIALAYLFYLAFERPFLNRPRTVPAAPPPAFPAVKSLDLEPATA